MNKTNYYCTDLSGFGLDWIVTLNSKLPYWIHMKEKHTHISMNKQNDYFTPNEKAIYFISIILQWGFIGGMVWV